MSKTAAFMDAKPKTAKCQHKDFITSAAVSAVQDCKKRVVGHQLVVKINCADCGSPFHFQGVPGSDTMNGMVAGPITTNKGIQLQIGIAPGLWAPEEN